jgi:DNA/RNA-binding domain of Phe-tRNA-synthetase-like protein
LPDSIAGALGDSSVTLPSVAVAPAVDGLIGIGRLSAGGLAVEPSGPAIRSAMEAEARVQFERWGGRTLGEIPGVKAVRGFFSELGIDPTKTRPSAEALLRRVLKGNGLPAVNNIVDVVNVCSLRWLLPIGLYDAGAIQGPVRLEIGGAGAGYPGLGKDWVSLEGRPAMMDDQGPFGAPTSDSFRTRVHEHTRDIFLVVFAPRRAGEAALRESLGGCLADVREALIALCGVAPGDLVSDPG